MPPPVEGSSGPLTWAARGIRLHTGTSYFGNATLRGPTWVMGPTDLDIGAGFMARQKG